MSKRKICVVVTARPSYSRVKTVLKAIDQHSELELQLVVARSALLPRYGTAVDFIKADGFQIDAKVFSVLEGENTATTAKTTGLGILELSSVFENLQPDIVVTVADRFETMSTAIATSYMNIPLAHLQGGEVTGNIDEKVRHAITKLADYHFVSSDDAYRRVIKLGEDKSSVFNTGCPSIDLARPVLKSKNLSFDPYQKYGGVGHEPDLKNGYLVVMQHPVTTHIKESRQQIEETLKAIDALKLPTLWFWPNIDAGADGTSSGIRAYREYHELKHVHFFKNLSGEDFLELIYHCKALIGNSSVGIREASFLGVPVVNIGDRQNRRQRGQNVLDVECETQAITKAIKTQIVADIPKSKIYGQGDSGQRIADLLAQVELKFYKTICY
ncbi:UDP-N-acetylglucosamine 2-epimerase [Flavobacterium sp. CS20]|uniref:UDP-N-acetylglucosamine 2-epimerase n=1 Tax=Flavobacterium sp. CS20 TaxID=2775246 RepID=UPI001B3A4C35|nr:UDP-N-acetylglucosamine 2-epimerase [Flavobacterium sp. CS20]QTY28140.1 UDP-N-acetylglucosamine 2-epimerase (hydrolyzing) [Flavobacterium sp. CS20]